MVDEKRVIIGNKNTGIISMMWGTGVKGSPNIENSDTPTFSGTIVQGTENVSWGLEIDRLRYDDMETHMALDAKLISMMSNPEDITVVDTVKPKGKPAYEVTDLYVGCIVDGNDYEMSTEDLTTESLKFKASKRKRSWKKL